MTQESEFIIVGSGLTGAVIARQLRDAGKEVLVLEKKNNIGGNCHDVFHRESSLRYSLYGPHYFRTSSKDIWEWAKRFAQFREYRATVKILDGGGFFDWPITRELIEKLHPNGWEKDPHAGEDNFEGRCLESMPRDVYERFVRPYTEKQWDRPARDMSSSLASRVEVRDGSDRYLSQKQYQGIPRNGYTEWISAMLHKIPVELGVDYLAQRENYSAKKYLIFTGPIDAYFNHDLGRLEYRGQKREVLYFPKLYHIQPVAQINYPNSNMKAIREIEWRHIWPRRGAGTLITRETPIADAEEYPVPDSKNRELYNQYRQRADALNNTIICGRMGEFTYYDMDQAIARAMKIARDLCES